MASFKDRAPPAPSAVRLTSLVGPVLLLSALGFVFLLAAGSNLAGAIVGMLAA